LPVAADHPSLTQRSGTLVETDRVDPLGPARMLDPQVMVKLQPGPPVQHLRLRDVALRQPPLGQQLAKQRSVGLVRLGPALRPAQHTGIGRLRQMRRDSRGTHLLGHVPPPGAALHRERHPVHPVEPAQPTGQMLPIRRRDPTTLDPPRLHLQVVERQLLPMNIHPTYDRHQGPPQAP
jgi:hypothetical protein